MSSNQPERSAAIEEGSPKPGSRGGKRRRLILNAFHDCILRKGYAKTTLRDVSRGAGMSASHLLYYFPGKDAMLQHYFNHVANRIRDRLESFRHEDRQQQIELLSDLFFAGRGITRSEIGFMLECFGVAVHDRQLGSAKRDLDRYCKAYLQAFFDQSPSSAARAADAAEIAYSLLIGLRTAAYFDDRLDLAGARRLFHSQMLNLAGIRKEGDK